MFVIYSHRLKSLIINKSKCLIHPTSSEVGEFLADELKDLFP